MYSENQFQEKTTYFPQKQDILPNQAQNLLRVLPRLINSEDKICPSSIKRGSLMFYSLELDDQSELVLKNEENGAIQIVPFNQKISYKVLQHQIQLEIILNKTSDQLSYNTLSQKCILLSFQERPLVQTVFFFLKEDQKRSEHFIEILQKARLHKIYTFSSFKIKKKTHSHQDFGIYKAVDKISKSQVILKCMSEKHIGEILFEYQNALQKSFSDDEDTRPLGVFIEKTTVCMVKGQKIPNIKQKKSKKENPQAMDIRVQSSSSIRLEESSESEKMVEENSP